ncbi:hypothetical protein GJA_882 [Janthinobacterium agaricidamnosum NBRC 102515 = DSM 9628]|uniref:Uncharacterized protein n=1 Tax=Janthinobacterium agaricidamnosum NBRC 102515 = DSM 9628 TaxID=1349767 RepID=W0UYA8_9BURK|nr:hypothetical protein GJA_882 [Janthinobacterium agaricidamnosum NBRC 102515 = DSM 9628]
MMRACPAAGSALYAAGAELDSNFSGIFQKKRKGPSGKQTGARRDFVRISGAGMEGPRKSV